MARGFHSPFSRRALCPSTYPSSRSPQTTFAKDSGFSPLISFARSIALSSANGPIVPHAGLMTRAVSLLRRCRFLLARCCMPLCCGPCLRLHNRPAVPEGAIK